MNKENRKELEKAIALIEDAAQSLGSYAPAGEHVGCPECKIARVEVAMARVAGQFDAAIAIVAAANFAFPDFWSRDFWFPDFSSPDFASHMPRHILRPFHAQARVFLAKALGQRVE